MPPVISAHNLSKSFGSHPILRDLSLEIQNGDIYGLVGLNGAGKTTLIRLLLGIFKPCGGSITVLDCDPWSHNAALFRRFGVVLEHDGFWGNLTLEQNLKVFARAKGLSWQETSRYLDEYWSGTALYNNKKAVKFFSRGQRMQCAICRAFLGKPDLFFFDEPVIALDVDAYGHFSDLVKEAQARGATILISSHQLDAIDDLCNRVGALRDMQITELRKNGGTGTAWELTSDPNARWASIIREVCGSSAVFRDGCWRFDAVNPDEMIPVLVAQLVKAGCVIKAIAPSISGFRNVIRNEYRSRVPLQRKLGTP